MSEFKVETLETIQQEAAELGCEAVVAKDNELQFDLDNVEARLWFEKFYEKQLANRFYMKVPRRSWRSRSGNLHVVVTLPHALPVPERIALQLAGGSDPKREFAALCCHWDGSLNPVLLFKPKETR